MDEPKPKRRWYRKKRWWLATSIWLVVAYLGGLGPAEYANGRGWDPYGMISVYQRPYFYVAESFERYRLWWGDIGFRHQLRERDRAFVPDPAVNRTHRTPNAAP